MDLQSLEVHGKLSRAFAERSVAPTVAARDRESSWDRDLFQRMGEAGLLGAALPAAYGGGDQSALGVSHLQTGFAEGAGDAGLCLAWGAHLTGAAIPILRLGRRAQRERYLPALARGEAIGALAHRESMGSTDPHGLRARAVKIDNGWILRGHKTWVVNGGVADVLVVTAVTDPRGGKNGVSTFLVDRATPGFQAGRRIETAGMRTAVISEITFEDCELPEDALLGPEGSGLTCTLALVQRWERALSPAPWIGFMRALLDASIVCARERLRLGKPVAHSQSLRATLADMKIRFELCQRMAERAAAALDDGGPDADRAIAVSRLFVEENAVRMTRDALAVHGAEGMRMGRAPERLHRDAGMLTALGDEPDILRSVIAGSLLHLG